MKKICGPVQDIKPLKSGNLLITTYNIEQVLKLLGTKQISQQNMSITCSISWYKQFTLRKNWAPHFANIPLDTFLTYLRPLGAVSVNKLLSDPSKQDFPLFVITFLGNAPESIKLGWV